MDGVLFAHKNVWLELHKAYGTYEEGIALTERYLSVDYDRLVEEVAGMLWKGRPAAPFLRLIRENPCNPGVKERQQGRCRGIPHHRSADRVQ